MNYKQFKEEILKDDRVKKAYEKQDLAFEMGKILVEARLAKNLTQKELANLLGTKQPSIARIERGDNLPSLSFLEKIAKALEVELLLPKFTTLNSDKTKTADITKYVPEAVGKFAGSALRIINKSTYSPELNIIKNNYE